MSQARGAGTAQDPRPRVFLHIGMNKTGTSAIQRFLADRADALATAGVLYPRAGREGDAHYGLSRSLGFRHARHARAAREPGAIAAELATEIRAQRPHTLVFSTEDFVLPGDVSAVRAFLADHDVRVVVYLRRHDHWWLSVYNQAVRMVAKPPWESGLQGYLRHCRSRRNPPGRYRELVDRWAREFGAAALVVRPYEGMQNPGGVVADFLHSIGLEAFAAEAGRAGTHANASIGFEALHIVDLLQRAEMDPALRHRLVQAALEQGRAWGGEALQIRPRLRQRLIEENRADYAYIARTYLGREDGVLFREPEPEQADERPAPELPDRVRVVERLVALCAPGG